MKIFKPLVLLFSALLLCNVGFSQLEKGFDLKVNFGFPSENYGGIDSKYSKFVPDYNTVFGVSMANRWYVYSTTEFGVAVNVRWLDFNFASTSDDIAKYHTFDIAMCGLGPMFTYKPVNHIGIDAYYNLRPGAMYTKMTPDVDKDAWARPVGFGISHDLGIAFRLTKFQFGFEYEFGKYNDPKLYTDDEDYDLDGCDMSLKNLRLFLGFKFN